MEPNSQAALGEGLAGCPGPPVPLDTERRGHAVRSAGEGLAAVAGVDAGGGGLLLVDVGGHWGHRQAAGQPAPTSPPSCRVPSSVLSAHTIHHQLQADVVPQAGRRVPKGEGVDASTGLSHLLQHQGVWTVAPGDCLSVLVPGPGREFRGPHWLHPWRHLTHPNATTEIYCWEAGVQAGATSSKLPN